MDSTGITLAIDSLRQALAKICDLSGERLHKQQWPAFSGLPTGLSEEDSAVGGVQFLNLGHIAASLIASTKIWASPHLLISVGQVADGVEDTAGYALHSVHDLNRLVDAAWKIVTVEMIISVWAILRRRLDIQSLGERVRHVVERLQPMLPIHVEGEEIFKLGPIVDLVRSGEMLSSPGS
jgi:histidine ammonia-lyase